LHGHGIPLANSSIEASLQNLVERALSFCRSTVGRRRLAVIQKDRFVLLQGEQKFDPKVIY
jgi:hypothetical protein